MSKRTLERNTPTCIGRHCGSLFLFYFLLLTGWPIPVCAQLCRIQIRPTVNRFLGFFFGCTFARHISDVRTTNNAWYRIRVIDSTKIAQKPSSFLVREIGNRGIHCTRKWANDSNSWHRNREEKETTKTHSAFRMYNFTWIRTDSSARLHMPRIRVAWREKKEFQFNCRSIHVSHVCVFPAYQCWANAERTK